MKDLLSRTAYRKVVKGLERYRKEAEAEKRIPGFGPVGYGLPLRFMIEDVIRESPEDRFSNRLPDLVLVDLVHRGHLRMWRGDYIFPCQLKDLTSVDRHRSL